MLDNKIQIIIRRLNFVVKLPNAMHKNVIEHMMVRLSTFSFKYDHKRKRNIRVPDKLYAVENNRTLTYRFNINLLKNFMLLLGNNFITKDQLDISFDKDCNPSELGLDFISKYTPREYQEEYYEALVKEPAPYMLVDLMMGLGKTYISMLTATRINQKMFILVLPKYINKWIGDVKTLTNVADDEIYVIKGADSLNNLIALNQEGSCKHKFIIAGIRTMYNYIKDYENAVYEEEFTYLTTPDILMSTLGVGIVLNDETHQEFHAVFKLGLYFDSCRFIGLSATLENLDKSVNDKYDIMFPNKCRISGLVEFVPYVETYNVRYAIYGNAKIKHQRQQGYSHNLFEESFMRNSMFLKDYVEMLTHYCNVGYIQHRTEGDKLLIFVASIKFATLLTQHLSIVYDYLDVKRYVEDDPYENIMDSDICVSTVQSSGTALDIPDLITVIQTVSMRSLQANKQSFGRLRNLKGKVTRFYSIYSKSIPKQVMSAGIRKQILKKLSNNWYEEEYSKEIRSR